MKWTTKDLLLQWSKRPMTNGCHLSEDHWLLLASVSSPNEQEKLLEQACQLSLGTRAFAKLVEASTMTRRITPRGTRRPLVPTSEVAVLQRYSKLAIALINSGVAAEQLWSDLETLPAHAINEAVLHTLQKTQEVVDKLREQLDAAKQHLDASIERAAAIMKEPKETGVAES